MRRPLSALVLLLCATLTAQQKPTLSDAQKQKLNALIGKLASDDFATRKQALVALKKLLLHLNSIGRTEALCAYLRQKIEDSRDAHTRQWLKRLWVIVRFGVTDALLKQLPDLLEWLTSPLKEEGLRVISRLENLGRRGVSDVAKPLIGYLRDANSDIRRVAAYALGEIKAKEAAGPLVAALKDEDWRVREEAAEALGKIGAKEAVEPLIEALKDGNSSVREAAAYALGEIGDRRAIKALEDVYAKDESTFVKIGAAYALRRMDKNEQAFEYLSLRLEDKDWRIRAFAAFALGKTKAKEAVKPLVTALKDADWRVRRTAVYALGKISAKEAVMPLIATLKDRSVAVRVSAAEVLNRITGKSFGSNYDRWLKWWQEQQNSNKKKEGAGTAR